MIDPYEKQPAKKEIVEPSGQSERKEERRTSESSVKDIPPAEDKKEAEGEKDLDQRSEVGKGSRVADEKTPPRNESILDTPVEKESSARSSPRTVDNETSAKPLEQSTSPRHDVTKSSAPNSPRGFGCKIFPLHQRVVKFSLCLSGDVGISG